MSGFIYERTPTQIEIDKAVLARVKKGIAKLEATYGPDWHMKVDLDTLDLASEQHCVLGQVYGWYGDGCTELGIRGSEGEHYGFDVIGVDYETIGDAYEELDEAWKHVISEARS